MYVVKALVVTVHMYIIVLDRVKVYTNRLLVLIVGVHVYTRLHR